MMGLKPKLGIFLRSLDVNVRRFRSFLTKEKESIRAFPENLSGRYRSTGSA